MIWRKPGVEAHGMCQASGLLEIVIGPGSELREGMLAEELGRHPLGGELPRRGLGAVLAIFEGVRIRRLGPGAAHAGIAVRLVLLEQDRIAADETPLLGQDALDGFERSPPPCRPRIGLDLWLVAHGASLPLAAVHARRSTQLMSMIGKPDRSEEADQGDDSHGQDIGDGTSLESAA